MTLWNVLAIRLTITVKSKKDSKYKFVGELRIYYYSVLNTPFPNKNSGFSFNYT